MQDNKIIIPSVGRRVWFRCGEAFANRNGLFKSGDQPMDAGIVYVHSDTCVNLLVADHMGVTKALTSVLLVQPGVGTVPVPDHYCEWMPYQVGQAKKDAEPERVQIGLPVRDTMRNEDVLGTVATGPGPLPEDSPAQQDELEVLRMQLAACGVAAMANTRDSFKKQRLPPDSPYRSASYGDVLNAVEREMDERERADEMAERNIALAHELHELARSKDALRAELDALRKLVRGEESSRPDGIVVLPKGVSIADAVAQQETKAAGGQSLRARRDYADGAVVGASLSVCPDEVVAEHGFTLYEAIKALGHPVQEDLKRITLVVQVLDNGHVVVGQSACADATQFSRALGEKYARQDASTKVSELLAFRARDNASTWAKAYGKA